MSTTREDPLVRDGVFLPKDEALLVLYRAAQENATAQEVLVATNSIVHHFKLLNEDLTVARAALDIIVDPSMWESFEGTMSGQDGTAESPLVWKGAGECACPMELAGTALAATGIPDAQRVIVDVQGGTVMGVFTQHDNFKIDVLDRDNGQAAIEVAAFNKGLEREIEDTKMVCVWM